MKKIKTEMDKVLEQLVADRREEVIRLQTTQANRQREIESAGQTRLSQLQDALSSELGEALKAQERSHEEQTHETRQMVSSLSKELSVASSTSEQVTLHPGVGAALNASAAAVGWLTPYYGTLHGSDGSVYWQGYNPGNIDASVYANGAGSGLFGTGAGSFTVYMDWWFTYRAPENRNYSHTVSVPFNGFYIVRDR